MHDLVDDGNSVLLVDHDTQILKEADWLIEMGPEAGADGGRVIAEGTIEDIADNPDSKIGPFIKADTESANILSKLPLPADTEWINMKTSEIHTVKPLDVRIPKGKLTVVTGVSGSGKTTMILESLVPAIEAATSGSKLPEHVLSLDAEGIEHVKLIDATPIGINIRSTVATYANVHDELRKIYGRRPESKAAGTPAEIKSNKQSITGRFI
jgi:excinuclease ABC subunit A